MTDVRDNRGPFAVAITMGAYQPVVLARDKNVRTATQTWEVETVLLAEPKQLYRGAMDSIDELAARFVTAYRSVNPQVAACDHELACRIRTIPTTTTRLTPRSTSRPPNPSVTS